MIQNDYFIVVNFTGYKLSATIDLKTVTVEDGKSSDLQKFSGELYSFLLHIRDINLENGGVTGSSAYLVNDSNIPAKSDPSNPNSFTIFEFTSRNVINIYISNSKTYEAIY